MSNQIGRNRIMDNMGVLNQRNSMDNHNMGMQEMNAQHGQRIRLSDNTVEQSPIFGRQMSLAGNLHGQMRPRDNTDNKRNSYTKMIASGRTKRSDDSYSYSVTGIPTSFSFCFKVSCLNVQDDSLMSDIIFYLYSKNLEPNLICCSPSPSRLKAISSLQQRVVNGKDSPRYE